MSMIFQYGLAFFWMCIIPLLAGGMFVKILAEQKGFLVVSAMGTGLVLNYGVYQIAAMIFVLLDGSFRLLSWIYIGASMIMALLGVYGWYCYFKKQSGSKRKEGSGKEYKCYKDPYFLMGAALVAVQVLVILVMSTPDKDDAFYTGLSSMCLSYDYVLKYSAYDGLMQMPIETRYIMAALPVYQASLSLMSKGLHTLIICHNLYPLFYMPLSYGLYCMLAHKLTNKKEDLGKFLLFFAFLHMFGNYYVFSPENFLITRIWQGKALFITISLPYVWYFMNRAWEKESTKEAMPYWFLVAAGLLAGAFMGETGLYLNFLVTGVSALANLIVRGKWKNGILAALSLLPEVLLMAVFLL
ncbi:MAG: hypothetical protein HDR01_07455 [Lachnospiraceae bacterium]|nr:hypothetical protein [Lachnospiraceae bacterium]